MTSTTSTSNKFGVTNERDWRKISVIVVSLLMIIVPLVLILWKFVWKGQQEGSIYDILKNFLNTTEWKKDNLQKTIMMHVLIFCGGFSNSVAIIDITYIPHTLYPESEYKAT